MRIMLEAGSEVVRGYKSVLVTAGHELYEWNATIKPAFDAFDEFSPELFIGIDFDNYQKQSWSKAVSRCLLERKGRTLAASIYRNNYRADTFRFRKGSVYERYKCDIACLDDLSVPDEKFDAMIMPLINKGLNVKVVGNRHRSIPQYLGNISDFTLCDLYASARVSIALSPYKDVYNILMANGCPVSLYADSPDEYEDDEFLCAEDYEEFHHWVRIGLNTNSNKIRESFVKSARNHLRTQSTYWHGVSELFESINMSHEANRIKGIFNETVKF